MIILAPFYHRYIGYLLNSILIKILLTTYKALNGLAPQYLSDLLPRYIPTRSLRSQNSGLLIDPRYQNPQKEEDPFHIWLLNYGIVSQTLFEMQTHSLSLSLDLRLIYLARHTPNLSSNPQIGCFS